MIPILSDLSFACLFILVLMYIYVWVFIVCVLLSDLAEDVDNEPATTSAL